MSVHVNRSANLGAVNAARWRSELADGRVMHGLWIASGSATAAEILGGVGAEWLIIDTEHSMFTPERLLGQLRALESAPVFTVVRVASHQRRDIATALDLGARGLMVPMVESAADAEAIVELTRYAPTGTRGVGGAFARVSRWNQVPDYLTCAESTFSLIAQVESPGGLRELRAILEVDGIDAVFVGPADLAASMSLLGQPQHPTVRDAVFEAIDVIRRAGKVAGVNAFDPADAIAYARRGAQLIGIGADVTLLNQGAKTLLNRLRAETPQTPQPTQR